MLDKFILSLFKYGMPWEWELSCWITWIHPQICTCPHKHAGTHTNTESGYFLWFKSWSRCVHNLDAQMNCPGVWGLSCATLESCDWFFEGEQLCHEQINGVFIGGSLIMPCLHRIWNAHKHYNFKNFLILCLYLQSFNGYQQYMYILWCYTES